MVLWPIVDYAAAVALLLVWPGAPILGDDPSFHNLRHFSKIGQTSLCGITLKTVKIGSQQVDIAVLRKKGSRHGMASHAHR